MSSGKVRRAVHDDCMEYLRNEPDIEPEMDESHDLVVDDMPTSIDCGLKRVDSKRYKRDYNINREAPKSAPRKWEVKLAPGLQKAPAIGQDSIQEAEVVKSTPAGTREVAHDKINEAEQQVYITVCFACCVYLYDGHLFHLVLMCFMDVRLDMYSFPLSN